MKKFLLFVSILTSFLAQSQTSIYHPFPDSIAVWSYKGYIGCGASFDYYSKNFSIQMGGDTLIGGVIYKKLVVPQIYFHSDGMCSLYGTWTDPGYYAGSIRQDTVLKKVFIVPPTTNIEELLYDFNLQVGDTVKGYIGAVSGEDVVISIDSVLVGNSFRKRWLINDFNDVFIIEGVGSTFGLLTKSVGPITCGFSQPLYCFSMDSILMYPDTVSSCPYYDACKAKFNIYSSPSAWSNWFIVSNISGVPPFSYLWNWGDGTTDTTEFPQHIYNAGGNYNICVTITDAIGCVSTYCDNSVHFFQNDTNVITIDVMNYNPLGIENEVKLQTKIRIYPNPANSTLYIQSPSKQAIITDASGKVLMKIKLKNGEAIIDIFHLANGLYFIQNETGRTQKFVIQH